VASIASLGDGGRASQVDERTDGADLAAVDGADRVVVELGWGGGEDDAALLGFRPRG